ncbi:hypothetical protein [Crenobacter cavernae]|uniref:Uncharacterized protein n=1 Tax=Crenobacter cavernae TaxID=2290923 RepID=A0ABY0F992_9NEIS|nr:hypothetical protein [Crenobacter cavernae]RXZ42043.1 hypothetical protein EBB06_13415 [Crenobacter cavernae]
MKMRFKRSLAWLSAAPDVYVVPIAAAVIGWLTGSGLALQILDWLGFESGARLVLAASSLFAYGTQMAIAMLLFFIAKRYLA